MYDSAPLMRSYQYETLLPYDKTEKETRYLPSSPSFRVFGLVVGILSIGAVLVMSAYNKQIFSYKNSETNFYSPSLRTTINKDPQINSVSDSTIEKSSKGNPFLILAGVPHEAISTQTDIKIQQSSEVRPTSDILNTKLSSPSSSSPSPSAVISALAVTHDGDLDPDEDGYSVDDDTAGTDSENGSTDEDEGEEDDVTKTFLHGFDDGVDDKTDDSDDAKVPDNDVDVADDASSNVPS